MTSILSAIEPLMNECLGAGSAAGVFRTLPTSVHQEVGSLTVIEVRELLLHLETSVRLFARAGKPMPVGRLRDAITGGVPAKPREERYPIKSDRDVLVVQRATQLLTRGFFGVTDGVRLATAVSELARNIYMYAGQGEVTLRLSEEPTAFVFGIFAADQGPGIPHLATIMKGDYRSSTGLGRGIVGTQALLNSMHVDTAPGKGTRITGERRVRKS